MASDGLNEIGKYLNRNRKDTDHVLKRTVHTYPLIERARDIFDEDIPFEMVFETDDRTTRVVLDVSFNKPPPQGLFDGDCGIFDSFSRTVVAGWGISEVGNFQWSDFSDGSFTTYVDDVSGILIADAHSSAGNRIIPFTGLPLTVRFNVSFDGYFGGAAMSLRCRVGLNTAAELILWPGQGIVEIGSVGVLNNNQVFNFDLSGTLSCLIEIIPMQTRVKVWSSLDSEPDDWLITTPHDENEVEDGTQLNFRLLNTTDTSGFMATVDNVEVTSNGKVLSNCTVYRCDTCATLYQNNRNATTSWYNPFGFVRVSDGAGGETTSGPSFLKLSSGSVPASIFAGEISATFNSDASQSNPQIVSDEELRTYASFPIDSTTVAVHFIGDLYIETAWGGAGQIEAEALLPPTNFELVAVAYDTANLVAHGNGGESALNLNSYHQWVVASGTHPGIYTVPYHIDAAINIDPTGLTYLGFFLRNLGTQTVGVLLDHNSPFGVRSILFDRYPGYPTSPSPSEEMIAGGIALYMDTYTVEFCTCPASNTGGNTNSQEGEKMYPIDCKVFIDDEDITNWAFGSETVSPDDVSKIWNNIDISQYVKSPGKHKIRVESGGGMGRVEARVRIS